MNIQEAKDPIINPAQIAQELLSELKGLNPFNLLKHTTWYRGGGLVLAILIILCAFLLVCRQLQRELQLICLGVHCLHLEKKKGGDDVWELSCSGTVASLTDIRVPQLRLSE